MQFNGWIVSPVTARREAVQFSEVWNTFFGTSDTSDTPPSGPIQSAVSERIPIQFSPREAIFVAFLVKIPSSPTFPFS